MLLQFCSPLASLTGRPVNNLTFGLASASGVCVLLGITSPLSCRVMISQWATLAAVREFAPRPSAQLLHMRRCIHMLPYGLTEIHMRTGRAAEEPVSAEDA